MYYWHIVQLNLHDLAKYMNILNFLGQSNVVGSVRDIYTDGSDKDTLFLVRTPQATNFYAIPTEECRDFKKHCSASVKNKIETGPK